MRTLETAHRLGNSPLMKQLNIPAEFVRDFVKQVALSYKLKFIISVFVPKGPKMTKTNYESTL